MNAFKKSSSGSRARVSKSQFVTKSGKTIKIHRSLSDRIKAHKDAKMRWKADLKNGLPKGRLKRFLARFEPKRLYHYWFSRQGAIMALKIAGIGILAGFVLMVGMFAYFRKDLPNLKEISGTNLGGSISYYDKTGQTLLWEDYDAVKRIPVKDEQISKYMKQATIAIEDKDFYKHGGFDVRGIMRAGFNDVVKKGSTQGGSTITQQLVKLTQNWSKDQTITRKIKELILAVELEREYSKQEILTGYLNAAPYGNVQYGVEVSARDYFQKSAKDLTIEESAFLAAIPKSPSFYSPYGPYYEPDALIGRQHYIIDQMRAQGMITKSEADAAKKVDILAKIHEPTAKYAGIKAPYFVLAAKSELEQKYGAKTINRGGWKVITTLDMDLQNLAEKAVQDDIPTIKRYGGDTAAFVAEDVKTGQIVSLVGNTEFDPNDKTPGSAKAINFAHDALIPPGSSFKPYDYAALINYNTNVGAGSVLYDTQGPLPGYPCTDKGLPPPKGKGNCLQDYDFRYPGPMTLRYALGGSRNVPAVKANLMVGTNKVIDMASQMMYNPDKPNAYNCYSDEALTQTTPCYGASAIGDGAFLHLDDHVNGLATMARMGNAIPRTYLLKITDAANKNVALPTYKAKQVIKPDTAYIVNDMAADPNASYLPAGYYKFHRYKGWNFAVKTGTTNNAFDGLMASWSTQYAAVSWVGYHTRNKAMTGSMELMTAPITRTWMQGAHDKLNAKPTNWTAPQGLKTQPAFVVRSHVGIGSVEPSPSNDIFPSWYTANNKSTNATIDKISNKLATECTPERAKQTVGGADANSFSVDTFAGASGNGQTNTNAKDDVHQCSDAKPAITLTVNDQGNGSYQFVATVTAGTHPLSSDKNRGSVTFSVNGQQVASHEIDSSGTVSADYAASSSGSATVTATVVDSVLYDATDTATVNFTAGGSNNSNLNFRVQKNGGLSVSFLWNDIGNSYSLCYVKSGDTIPHCSSYAKGTTTSGPLLMTSPGSYSATLDAGFGLSNPITYSVP